MPLAVDSSLHWLNVLTSTIIGVFDLINMIGIERQPKLER